VFAVIILGTFGLLFRFNSPYVLGHEEDPSPEKRLEIASMLFGAVCVYIGFFVFCGSQALLHAREQRKGAIALT